MYADVFLFSINYAGIPYVLGDSITGHLGKRIDKWQLNYNCVLSDSNQNIVLFSIMEAVAFKVNKSMY